VLSIYTETLPGFLEAKEGKGPTAMTQFILFFVLSPVLIIFLIRSFFWMRELFEWAGADIVLASMVAGLIAFSWSLGIIYTVLWKFIEGYWPWEKQT